VALQLQEIITAARDRHPAFFKTRAPSATIGRFLSDYQNELIGKALLRDKQFLAQKAVIVVSIDGSAAPGTVGAGTGSGLPGTVSDAGVFSLTPATAGGLIEAVVDPAAGAQLLVSERVVSSASATGVTCTGAGWTVNAYVGRVVVITQGPGIGQRRTILSNTIDTLVISSGSDGHQWSSLPTAASLLEVVVPVYQSSGIAGVVTDVPATLSQTGYLVKLTAQGTPYIDYTAPLVASVETGVPLPTALAFLGGAVRYADGEVGPLTLATEAQRFDPPDCPAAYTVGHTLFLCGSRRDWQDVASLELDYVPIAPAFTQPTDYLLLPDAARPALVAAAAGFMAERVEEMADVAIDSRKFVARAIAAEAAYLSALRLTRRARRTQFRAVDY
jgi:hypothetical protein